MVEHECYVTARDKAARHLESTLSSSCTANLVLAALGTHGALEVVRDLFGVVEIVLHKRFPEVSKARIVFKDVGAIALWLLQ